MSAKTNAPNEMPSIAEFANELASTTEEYTNTLQPSVPDEPTGSGSAEPNPAGPPAALAPVMRIPLNLKVVLGSATMPMSELARLHKGALISLDRRVGDTADIVVNGHCFAKGEVVIVDEKTSRFGILLTDIGVLPPGQTERKREPGV